MIATKKINKICYIVMTFVIVLTVMLMDMIHRGAIESKNTMPYEAALFDTGKVHTLNIVADEKKWQEMLDDAKSETYISCNIVIDGAVFKNVAIRPKGNSTLLQVASSDSDRYSFKIEFDHYEDANTYFGLDKLCLNNIALDNTYLKDYISFDMMREAGVDAPLCSFTWITVNNEDWGLYTAVEGIEEGFAERVYGSTYGNIYKPDSLSINMDMDMDIDIDMIFGQDNDNDLEKDNRQGNMEAAEGGGMPEGMEGLPISNLADLTSFINSPDDVKLLYTDGNYESYANIFANAVFDINNSDKERLISSLKQLNEQENVSDVLDIESVINFFVAHNFVLNDDSYTGTFVHNYYLRESDGKLSMIPWDYNLAFGGMSGIFEGTTTLVNSPIDTPTSIDMSSLPMISWIFSDETYTQMYHEAFSNFISNYFDSGYFEEMIDSVIEMISPYVEKDPSSFCTYQEFTTACATLKEFCPLRAESIRGQLNGTIGSTDEEQAKDNSSFINTTSVNVSDMGANILSAMGVNRTISKDDTKESENNPEMDAVPAGGNILAEGADFFNDIFEGGGEETSQSLNSTILDAATASYLAVLVLILLIGLVMAKRYRR